MNEKWRKLLEEERSWRMSHPETLPKKEEYRDVPEPVYLSQVKRLFSMRGVEFVRKNHPEACRILAL